MKTPMIDERALDFLLELRGISGTLTELVADMRGQTVNHTLYSGVEVLDSNGIDSKSFHVPYASVAIGNFGSAILTVTNDARQSTPPTAGAGVALVGPGDSAVIDLIGRELTLYGNPGDRIHVQVFTRPQGPAASGAGSISEIVGNPVPANGAPVAVAASAADQVLIGANAGRKGLLIYNASNVALNVAFGVVATAALFTVQVGVGQLYEMGPVIFTGAVHGISTAAPTGNLMITELV